MKNKSLILLICFLFPIAVIISFNNKVNNKKVDGKQLKENLFTIKITDTNKTIKLSLDEYIIGVLAAEMPAEFELEALKAQAIASRSYALANKTKREDYDFDDTTSDQAYITKETMKKKWNNKYNQYYNKIKDAVTSTTQLVMKHNDKIISAFYFSMSNGYTEVSQSVFKQELPYINSVESSWEKTNINFIFETKITKNDFCNKLEIDCSNININNIKRNSSNRIEHLYINNKKITGVEFRSLFALRSTDFEIISCEDNINIITKGYGHGVGMSQYGANGMAKEGKKYREILDYYYQDIKIEKI